MKKDVYPDVRIEIISEGLTKKILEQSKGAAPVVYGEEKPKGENLPNIDSKGKNKEMGGLLQVSNKKPTYTSIIKEAIIELRKQPQDYGFAQPGGRTKGAGRKIRESIGSSSAQSRRLQSAPRIQEVERNVPQPGLTPLKDEYGPVQERGVLGAPNIDEVSPGMPGAGGVPRIERRGSAVERGKQAEKERQQQRSSSTPKGFDSAAVSQRAASLASPTSSGTKGKAPTGGTGRGAGGLGDANPRDFSDSGSSSTSAETSGSTGGRTTRKLSSRPEVFQSDRPDFDMARGPGARVGDKKTKTQTLMTPGSGSLGEKAIIKEAVAEFLISKQPQSYGAATPGMGSQFGTSGGGSQPAMGGKQRPTPTRGQGTSGPRMPKSMSKNLQKQAPMFPPKTTSATKPANMGVGMQQPVVGGAGSMKNIDKAKMNKEPAPAAKRKTAPKPRKNIQAAIIKAATLALEKAKGKQGLRIPKGRQFKQSDLGRGATTFTETTEKKGKQGMRIPKGRQFRRKPKRATGGMAETYRG